MQISEKSMLKYPLPPLSDNFSMLTFGKKSMLKYLLLGSYCIVHIYISVISENIRVSNGPATASFPSTAWNSPADHQKSTTHNVRSLQLTLYCRPIFTSLQQSGYYL